MEEGFSRKGKQGWRDGSAVAKDSVCMPCTSQLPVPPVLWSWGSDTFGLCGNLHTLGEEDRQTERAQWFGGTDTFVPWGHRVTDGLQALSQHLFFSRTIY